MTYFYSLKKITLIIICLALTSLDVHGQKVTLRPASQSRPKKSVTLQNKNKSSKSIESKPRSKVQAQKSSSRNQYDAFEVEYQKAVTFAEQGLYPNAAIKLFVLLRSPQINNRAAKVRYLLGQVLVKMDLKQVASFQFIQAINLKNESYRKSSVQKLSEIAADLGDDTLLNYVFNNLQLKDFPPSERDTLYFKLGQVRYENEDYRKALELFNKVDNGSRYALDAQYYSGLSYSRLNQDETALNIFQKILSGTESKNITSPIRVQSQLAVARTLYKKKDWDNAILYYSKIPRDSEYWPDSLLEQTWAMLRSGRLRSALSNFHTLHSPFYENIYNPESLLLRSIVYLYICKYDEMEKVLSLYKKNYTPLSKEFRNAIRQSDDWFSYIDAYKRGRKDIKSKLPVGVLRKILLQEEIQNQFYYLDKITSERKNLLDNNSLKKTSLGIYGLKVLNRRISGTQNKISLMIKENLTKLELELRKFNEQADLIAFELTSGKTQQLKKKIREGSVASIDEKINRDFYVENGYQFYPFKGEYWLDEVGNYQYFGKQSCE